MTGVTFRPTTRTRLLMLAVIVAGIVGAVMLWRGLQAPVPTTSRPAAPPELTPLQQRAVRQLSERAGQPIGILLSTERRAPDGTTVLCGYAQPAAGAPAQAGAPRRPQRVYAFLSQPDRVLTTRDPEFGQRFAAACPGMQGAERR